jgi:hypothetical protein
MLLPASVVAYSKQATWEKYAKFRTNVLREAAPPAYEGKSIANGDGYVRQIRWCIIETKISHMLLPPC